MVGHVLLSSDLCIPLHLHSAPALRAQADRGEKATRFWLKQELRGNLAAAQLLEAMHLADPKLCPAYEGAAPMLWELRPPKAGRRGVAAASRANGHARRRGLKRGHCVRHLGLRPSILIPCPRAPLLQLCEGRVRGTPAGTAWR